MSQAPDDKKAAAGEPTDAEAAEQAAEVASDSADDAATEAAEAAEAAAAAKEAAKAAKRAASRARRSAAAESADADAGETDSGDADAGETGADAEADVPVSEVPGDAEPKAKPSRRRAAAASGDEPDQAQPAAAGGKGRAASGGAKTSGGKTSGGKASGGKQGAAQKGAKEKAAADGGTPASLDDLPAEIFDANVNIALMHQVVVAQQAAARQGTHATKNRGAVRGGGRKPYRQKGTGRARQGSVRAPQFAGGGIVHGPVPRSYAQRTPKKMKTAALRGALSDRARHGLVYVVDGFVDGDEPKTSAALAALGRATGMHHRSKSMLVVAEASDTVTWKSLRNAPGVHLIDPGQLNTYDVLVSDRVVFTRTALDSFVARAGRASTAPAGTAAAGAAAASTESEER